MSGDEDEEGPSTSTKEHQDEKREIRLLSGRFEPSSVFSEYVQLGSLGDYKDDVTPLLSPKHVPLVLGKVTKEAAIATHSALKGGISVEKEQE